MTLPERVKIVEVGPRDGLQNEPLGGGAALPTPVKLQFIHRLVEAGLRHIESTSFVHSDVIPQLADADQLVRQLLPSPGVVYSALVPNRRGLDRALAGGVRRIALFTAASEAFTQKNIRMTIEESLSEFATIVPLALREGISVRGYLSTCFVCPYQGKIPRETVRQLARRMIDLGMDEIALSDTIGSATPRDVHDTVSCVLEQVPAARLALHFHDTYGMALANVWSGLELGITTFDSSAGGLGGCPFAPGAAGNIATEDLVFFLERMEIQTGVDLDRLASASAFINQALGRSSGSRWSCRSTKTSGG